MLNASNYVGYSGWLNQAMSNASNYEPTSMMMVMSCHVTVLAALLRTLLPWFKWVTQQQVVEREGLGYEIDLG